MRFRHFIEVTNYVIYCDMDGVLTDLMGGIEKLTGERFANHRDAMRALVKLRRQGNVNIWENLEWTPHGKEIWDFIKPFNPYILTGAVEGVGAGVGKKVWAQRELGLPSDRVILSRQKEAYAQPNAVLIDDTFGNVQRWKNAGGIGILHSDIQYQKTIQELNLILN